MSNWYTKPTGGWSFSSSNNMLFNTSGSTNSLHYAGSSKTFLTNKTYLYKTKIRNLKTLSNNGISIKTPWNNVFRNLSFSNLTTDNGYINFYSSPTFRIDSSNNPDRFTGQTTVNTFVDHYSYLSYTDQNNLFGSTKGIFEIDIKELDWDLHGYSWIESIGLTSGATLSNSNKGKGWSYNSYDGDREYFEYFGNQSSGANPASDGLTSSTISSEFIEINHLSRYIEFNFFNLYFETVITGDGFKIYLSDDEPYKGTATQSFENWKNSSDLIASYTQSVSPTFSAFFGLRGNKYISFVADNPTNSIIRLYGLNIEGGYGQGNNRQYLVSATSSQSTFETSGLSGVTFSSLVGIGDTYNPGNTPQVSQIFSKIGNGSFKAGMWENGVWNNGWRLDNSVREFDDIDLSIKTRSDVRWRFRITGPSSSVSEFSIGDEITIGNIVAIDINERRRFIRDRYRVIGTNPTGINSRIGFLIVETDTTFPIRRIEKDSKKHKIKITKNGWLSGAFLNGYFTGVWNFGLFKGYPLITEMFNANWIDGIFDGGHFQSEYYISGNFNDVVFRDNKVGLTFSQPHRLAVGDIIEITMDDQTVNRSYNGEALVIDVINDFEIVTNKDFGLKRNTSGGPINTTINSLNIYLFDLAPNFTTVNVFIAISQSDFNLYSSIQNGVLGYVEFNSAFQESYLNTTSNFNFTQSTSGFYPGTNVTSNFNFYIIFQVTGNTDFLQINSPITLSGFIPTSITVVGNESGRFTTEIGTSVIQNMEFNSNNISKTTSIESLNTEDVFIYNSWVDVNYSDQSAVNIGRPQTKINEASRKSFSENNLYGYPTDDVLSSDSKFRDSYTLTVRDYKLGNKWKLFNDYVGESSKFTEYFGTSSQDTQLFIDQGWTFSKYGPDSITFSRTNDEGVRDISGEELKVEAVLKGGVLDLSEPSFNINSRNLQRIEKDRYTLAEFDLVTYSVVNKENPSNKFNINKGPVFYEPFIHFNNINTTKRDTTILGSTFSSDVPAEYLPIYRNIEHLETKKKRKVEFFFNKRNLSMNFTGGGLSNGTKSDYVLNNLKILEVDMIPFFQYFIDVNINKSIQIPFQGIAPYIDYESSDFSFVDSINIGLDSISVESTNELFSGVGQGVVSGGFGTSPTGPPRPTGTGILTPVPGGSTGGGSTGGGSTGGGSTNFFPSISGG